MTSCCYSESYNGDRNCLNYVICLLHYVSKNIPDIFDCNLKTNYQILIIFSKNILDTTCNQMTIQFLTSPNVCLCTTWEKNNQRSITFYPMQYDCLINITRKNTVFTFLTLWLAFHPVVHFSTACSKID